MRARCSFALGVVVLAVSAGTAGAAPTWLPPADLSAGTLKVQDSVQIALDGAGDATAVWHRADDDTDLVVAASRPAGGAWSPPVGLSTAGERAANPRLAVNAAGDAVAVWEWASGASTLVQAASRPAGGTWGAPVHLTAAGQSAAPQVALDAAGNAVAAWSRENGSAIRVRSRTAGGVWQPAVDISAGGTGAGSPRVALGADGETIAAWTVVDGATRVLVAATKPPGGVWQAPARISPPGVRVVSAEVALDAAGGATAVWQTSAGGSAFPIHAAHRPAGGSWEAPAQLTGAGWSTVSAPRLAVNAAGDAVAGWGGVGFGRNVAQAATRPAGGSWQPAADLSSTGRAAYEAAVAIDPGGAATAAWLEQDGPSGYDVAAASRPAGGTWLAPVELAPADPLGNASPYVDPQVAVDAAGDAVALWARNGSALGVVQASGLDAAGPRLRALSIPAAGAAGEPLAFSVSPFDVWSTAGAVSWSFGDGATAGGTAVQHAFAAPGTYAVTVTATDLLGNASSASGTVAVAARGGGGGGGGAGGGGGVVRPPVGVAKAQRVVLVRRGRARLQLSCGGRGACAGRAQLTIPARKQRGGRRRGASRRAALSLGAARFSIDRGKRKTIAVPLGASARRRLRAAGRAGLPARLAGSGVAARAVVLKQPKPTRRGSVRKEKR